MLPMLSNCRGGQKENKRLDAMNDSVPITASFAQATSNKKNITCLKCGKKGHYANKCPNTPTVVAAAQVVEDDDSNDDGNKPHTATPSHARGHPTSSTYRYA
jgi:Zinc knuckle